MVTGVSVVVDGRSLVVVSGASVVVVGVGNAVVVVVFFFSVVVGTTIASVVALSGTVVVGRVEGVGKPVGSGVLSSFLTAAKRREI